MATDGKSVVSVPLNRVEGDLEIRVSLQDGVVWDAWSSANMFRGMETLLCGRAPADALVLTSRVCGMCSVSHLAAAAEALDALSGATIPDNARRLRNLTLMAEHMQSDLRHAFLLFAVDLASPAHRDLSLHEEAVRRFEPFKGRTAVETIQETKRLIELIAILGGQWPHSAFMVPGGVSSHPGPSELLQCRHVLSRFQGWYEQRVLGCNLERWTQVDSSEKLDAWLSEREAHRDSEVGFFVRYAREAGLDGIGRGHGNFVSFGSLKLPASTAVPGGADGKLVPSGFSSPEGRTAFEHLKIGEHVAHSWYHDYAGGRHPFDGETRPYATGAEGQKYSWAKAPRYREQPAETGPLAERVLAGDRLFLDLLKQTGGPSVFTRQLARLLRPATFLPAMAQWLSEMPGDADGYYANPGPIVAGEGAGLIEAARGALGHWVEVEGGKITRYQIVTPTAWNGSPRDSAGTRGPWEQALVGTPVRDPANPVEVGHVVRSFDPCMVCCVHVFRHDTRLGRIRV